jgi:hypothetical protein
LASGTQIATSGTPLTLNNVDIIAPVTITTTPSTGQNATASDANGLLWRAGAVNVTAVPVIYTAGRSIASVAITLVNSGGDAALGRAGASVPSGGTVASQSGLTLTSGAASASFANSNTSPGVGNSTVDTMTVLVTSIDNTGNAGPSLSPTLTNFIRLDNRAPDITTVPPVVNLNVQNAQSNWVGANFVFSTTGSQRAITLDATTTGDNNCGTANCGVDNVKANTQWRTAGSGTFATFASTKDLAETAQATAYDLRLQICDALNNCNTTGTLLQFGVDLTAPSLAQTGGVKDGDIYNIITGAPASIAFTTSDPPGANGVSGSGNPAAGNSVLVRDQALKPNGIPGSQTVCAIGTASGSAPNVTCSAPAAQPNNITLPAAAINDGEYTLTAQAVDLAGNTSPTITIKYYVDLTAPTIPAQGAAMPNPITAGTSFTGFSASDNMDVKAGYGSLVYTGIQSFAETGTAAPTGAVFDNVLTQQSTVAVALSTFYRSLTTAVGTIGSAPASINVNVTDAAGNLSGAPLVEPLPPANIGAPTAALNAGVNAITAFAIDSTKPSPATADPGKPFVFHTNATPASDVTGNPFQQVCLFYQVTTNNQFGSGAAAGDLVKIGCTSLVATVGVGPTRRFWFPITWTPPAAFVNSTFQVFAVGHTSTLDGIISAPVTVTVNPVP